MLPINPGILTAFFCGVMIGMLLAAIVLFAYGLISTHLAYKKNERMLSDGLKKVSR